MRVGVALIGALLLLQYFGVASLGYTRRALPAILRNPHPPQPPEPSLTTLPSDLTTADNPNTTALVNHSNPIATTINTTPDPTTMETTPVPTTPTFTREPNETVPSAATGSAVRLIGQPGNMTDCPVIPPALVGPIRVWFDYPQWSELETLYPELEPGGHGKPASCKAQHRVAVIVPYRDREKHLRAFLHNLHSLLTKQQLDYAIIIVEQIPGQTFNRGKLMNVGFVEAAALYDFQCFIFHDVDLFPEDDRNIYSCPEQPRHMSVAVDKFSYRLPYADIFGGICALRDAHFRKINGVSNDFWGWGGEDDDFATRVRSEGFRISRYPANIARYKMIKHINEKENPVNKCRFSMIYKTKKRYKSDGLSSLSYERKALELRPLYTRVLVDLKEAEGKALLAKEGFKNCQ